MVWQVISNTNNATQGPPSQQVQQGGYVPSFGIEGRRGNNGISNSAQQYATSPKSGKGI